MTATRRKISTRTSLKMIDAMRKAPRTTAQLAKIGDVGVAAVRAWLRDMRETNLGRISGYAKDARGRLFTPLWALGGEPDAPRPGSRQTAAERMARTRARRRAASAAVEAPTPKKASRAPVGKQSVADGIGLEDLL